MLFTKPLLQFADAEEDDVIPSSNIEIKFSDKVMTSSYGSDVSDEEDIDDDFYEPDFRPVKTSSNLKSAKYVAIFNNLLINMLDSNIW